jgi:hypothetical protein
MGFHSLPELDTPPVFDHRSIFALGTVAALVVAACSSTITTLPPKSSMRIRLLFTWHLFDALVHLTLGGSYLYNVFFTSMSTLDIAYTRGIHSTPMTPTGVSFLSDPKHLYGAFYGTSEMARLWQEYAKADKRRGGSDLTMISNELLAVFVLTPIALYVCYQLQKQKYPEARFWMALVAFCELYGGFMAFLPEWLTGSPNLDTSNFLTLWIYLVLFNGLWVVFPLCILWDVYRAIKV